MLFNLCGSSFMALRGAKGIGEGLAGKKLGVTFDGDTLKAPDTQKPKKSMKTHVNVFEYWPGLLWGLYC